MAKFLSFTIEGVEDSLLRIGTLERKLRNRILRSAVNAALAPILGAARSGAPRQSGTLSKSLARIVRTYRMADKTFGIVGARVGSGRKASVGRGKRKKWLGFRDPVRYLHLVEFGARPHAGKVGKKAIATKHPGMKGKPFMRSAIAAGRSAAAAALASKISEGMAS